MTGNEQSPDAVKYELDRDDRIAKVNEAWNAFARANGAPGLTEPHVIGQWLWSLIDDASVAAVYRPILARVRAGHTVELPFRCDSPTVKRQMRLLLRRGASGIVECIASTQKQVEMAYNPLWDAGRPRGRWTVVVCAWCKHVRDGSGWHPPEEMGTALMAPSAREVPLVSQGICPSCEWRVRALLGST
jgi:hypothetical protein